MSKIVIISIFALFIFSCAGEDTLSSSSEPPRKPHLISHLGDTGDVIADSTTNYYNSNYEFEQNGIDAISDGDQIQIQWEPLQDTDIDYFKVYRFQYEDYQADTLHFYEVIDSVDYDNNPNKNERTYIDSEPPVEAKLFYFIEIFNASGLSAISDTVCYKLLPKPVLNFTTNLFNSIFEVEFSWELDDNISEYRILLFDDDYNLLWQYTPLDFELQNLSEDPIPYSGNSIETPNSLWVRIDAFGSDFDTEPINGQVYSIHSGSESEEKHVVLQ